jgi:GT2 family glycosyltransferase
MIYITSIIYKDIGMSTQHSCDSNKFSIHCALYIYIYIQHIYTTSLYIYRDIYRDIYISIYIYQYNIPIYIYIYIYRDVVLMSLYAYIEGHQYNIPIMHAFKVRCPYNIHVTGVHWRYIQPPLYNTMTSVVYFIQVLELP